MNKFALSCILTSLIIVIEILASATGEALSLITIVSTLFIYIICRKSMYLGTASYISVGLMLFLLNPHKMIVFIFINGLLGITLGFYGKKVKAPAISLIISGLMLTAGIITAFSIIGIFTFKWYFIASIFLFSCAYAAIYLFIAGKAYNKIMILEKSIKERA